MVVGQNTLSPTNCKMAGIRVRAAINAIMIPSARQIPMVEIMEYLHTVRAPNPMITAAPEMVIDSPAQTMDWCTASSCVFPERSSSL